jgi:hypothetical protein
MEGRIDSMAATSAPNLFVRIWPVDGETPEPKERLTWHHYNRKDLITAHDIGGHRLIGVPEGQWQAQDKALVWWEKKAGKRLERAKGFEPSTSTLARLRSTRLSYARFQRAAP